MSTSLANDESPLRRTSARRIRIELEGPINFRDLGGPPALGGTVRHGVAYRADGLHTMTLADLETVFGRLAVTTVIDLRTQDERVDPGLGLLADSSVTNHHVPILDQTSSVWAGGTVRLADLYRSMLGESADRFARAVHLIARADGPVVFHCAAGKDRTGLVAALVLGLLGVDDRDICDDYAATGEVAAQLRQRIEAMAADPRHAERFAAVRARDDWPELVEEITSARYSTMAGLLDEIRSTDGTITSWALRNGVAASDIAYLHRRMVVVRP